MDTILLGRPGSPEGHRGLLGDLSMAVSVDRGPNDTVSKSDLRAVRLLLLDALGPGD